MNQDDKIVAGIIKKDQKAVELLVDEYGGLIWSIVKFHLSVFEVYQEECRNDILLAIWQNIDRYDANKNSLKNWIGAISKYKCIDYKRKYYKELRLEALDETIPDTKNTFEQTMQNEIDSLLSGLSPGDRELFYRHYILGEKVETIAKDFHKSSGYFYNRLSRGRKKLKQNLRRSDYFESNPSK